VLGSAVYVAADGPKLFEGNVSRYDARTGVRENAVDLVACAIAAGDGVVWAAGCPSVQRLSTDARPFRILRERFLPFATPLSAETRRVQFRELAVGAGSLWVLGDALDRRLWRLDARTGVPQATVPLGFPPRTVAVGEGSVWITDSLDDALVRLDPKTNRVLGRIPVGRGASGVAVGAGSVWVTNALDGTVSRIDPRTLQVVDTVEVGGVPREVAAGGGSVWVTAHAR
jgi:YVTN family beta-propeller protein